MKVIIAGSRSVTEYARVELAAKRSGFEITEVVSGGARGVDKLGEEYAINNSLRLKVFPANWDQFGKSAGYIRNAEMAEYADALVAVWDGESKGTKNMIKLMKFTGKPFKVFAPYLTDSMPCNNKEAA